MAKPPGLGWLLSSDHRAGAGQLFPFSLFDPRFL